MMTSVVAFISILAGGSAQETLAVPANAAGAGGLFTALLAETGAPPAAEGETATTPEQFSPAADAGNGRTFIEVSASDTALRKALSEGLGLPRGGAEIDAAIIEGPEIGAAAIETSAIETSAIEPIAIEPIAIETAAIKTPEATVATAPNVPLPVPPQNSQGQTGVVLPEVPIQNNQTPQVTLEQKPVGVPEQIVAKNTPQPAPRIEDQGRQIEGQGRQDAKPNDAGRSDAAAPARGLENALIRAPQNAVESGLANAANRSAQPNTRFEPQRAGFVQGDNPGTAKSAPAPNAGLAEDTLTGKPDSVRPEFAPRGPRIIQQPLKPGSGQTLIRFQQHAGTEPGSALGPPTLTVSVPAHTASPSPAPANVPHVPVSALAVHIAQQASNGAKRFDIRLDPPELGRIEVRLEVSREGQVMTHLVVERSETLDLLQRDARHLERALQDAGLNTSKEDMKFSLKDQDLAQGGNGQENPEDEQGPFTRESDEDPSLIPNEAMPPPARYIASSGLDIRI